MSDSASIPPPPARNPKADRRVSVRYPCKLESYCQRGLGRSDHFWWFAKTLDLSAEGIGLVLRNGFEPGTGLIVELSSTDGNFTLAVEAQVVHSSQEPAGWVIGCVFNRKLTDAELRSLL
ncbi:MAG: PilZ domain-containing protein [Gemmataceae bacterium]|nr:PilZ domain-containing protein [Gemmataceae bacterium]